MFTWQKERSDKVQQFMVQWSVTEEVAKSYLESEEWIYWEACVSYRLDLDYETNKK